jgi:hypothetical protein
MICKDQLHLFVLNVGEVLLGPRSRVALEAAAVANDYVASRSGLDRPLRADYLERGRSANLIFISFR